MQLPIKITERALEEIKNILNRKGIPEGYGLRVAVKGNGCAGVQYILGFDQYNDEDLSYEEKGIQVFIKKKDLMHLFGQEIDYINTDDATGFVFDKS